MLVYYELVEKPSSNLLGKTQLLEAIRQVNIKIYKVADTEIVRKYFGKLHKGELETIVAAKELETGYLLLDEKAARKLANSLMLEPTGLIGILRIAKRTGKINQLKPLLDILIESKLESLTSYILKYSQKKESSILISRAGQKTRPLLLLEADYQGNSLREFYHLFRFELKEENICVTKDEEAYGEHLIVRKPTGLKIDDYFEKHKEVTYYYDFGDDWQLNVRLENIVDDYYFGFPTLLNGAETAPPEDVGGIPGFYKFMEIYGDESHPAREEMVAWAKGQYFREYDPKWINESLKNIKYKQTDWDKINHNNYKIIEDKYRKK